MAEHFKIVFDGQLPTGVDIDAVRLSLAQLLKSDAAAIDQLFTGGPTTVKRGLTYDDAQRYLNVLNEAGLHVHIEPEQAKAWNLETINDAAFSKPAIQPAASPYAPPRASVAHHRAEVGDLRVFTIQGRIGRLRYLAWTMALAFVSMAVGAACIGIMSQSLIAGGLLGTISLLACLFVAIQFGAQRLHDAGWSAWLLLLHLVPVLGSLLAVLMMVIPGNTGPNQYGPPPPANSKSVKILATLWFVVAAATSVGALTGGLDMIRDEVEVTTEKYEQTLPYDDDSDDMVQPGAPVDPADSGDSSDNDDTH